MPTGEGRPPLLEMRGVVKTFPGVRALDGVSFSVERSEVHALVGENGAGKSTLMRILAGAARADEGEILIDGASVSINGPRDAESLGIGMMYQEFNLVPTLGVIENILLGIEPVRGGILDDKASAALVAQTLAQLGITLPIGVPTGRLTVAQQQLTEIAKSLVRKARIIVMDEPTAALGEREIDRLFALITKLRREGVAFVYISHRMEELPRIADRITVLRDGRAIETRVTSAFAQPELIHAMVGRDVSAQFPELPPVADDAPVVLSIENLVAPPSVRGVSFSVRAGEIIGLAGLVGAGRTEILRAIAGADLAASGEMTLNGTRLRPKNPADAINAGIAFITEDRKAQGLVLGMSVRENITLAHLELVSRGPIIEESLEEARSARLVDELRVRTPSTLQLVRNLSGGNQQKVVLAKWLLGESRVFLFDEPTRGIDIGAKAEIYLLLTELARKGAAIVLVSSELPEVMGLCHRILVVRRGEIAGDFRHGTVTADEVIAAAIGAAPATRL